MPSSPIVFIVDDDPAALSSATHLLSSLDLNVEAFDSAESFLAAFSPHKWGCLLVDVRMPGMSGRQLQQALKQDDIDMPVILISGYTDDILSNDATADAAFAVLEKPVDAEELIGTIHAAINAAARNRTEHF